jgi:outer membrane protein
MSRSHSDRPFLAAVQGPWLLALALAGGCSHWRADVPDNLAQPAIIDRLPVVPAGPAGTDAPSRERTEVARGRAAPDTKVRLAGTSRPGEGQNPPRADGTRNDLPPAIDPPAQVGTPGSSPTASNRPSDSRLAENIRDDVKRTGYPGDPGQERTGDPSSAVDPFEAGTALSLGDAVDYGVRHNPRLARSAANIKQARAGEMIAFAPFLPEIVFQYQAANFGPLPVLPASTIVPATLGKGVNTFSVAEFGTQYILTDFGRRSGKLGIARSTERINGLLHSRARQTIAYDVVSAYLQVLAAKAGVRVREEALEQARADRKDAEFRHRQGSIDSATLLEADVGVTRAEARLVAARQSVFDATSLLNLALGRTSCGPISLIDINKRPEFARSLDECLETAIKGRDEIGVARQEMASAAFGEQVAHGEYLPRVFVRAAGIRLDTDPTLLHNWVGGVGLHAEQTLFAGGRVTGGLRAAQADAEAALAGLRIILQNVTNQVNIAHNAIATAQERVRLGEMQLVQAQEQLRVLLARYRKGDAILSDVIEARTSSAQSELDYATSLYDYLEVLSKLEYAQGGDQSCLLAELERTPDRSGPRFLRPLPSLERPGTPDSRPPATGADVPDAAIPPGMPEPDHSPPQVQPAPPSAPVRLMPSPR